MSIHSFWGHLRTVTRHRHQVIRCCAHAGILWQGLRHDLSKFSPSEFRAGVAYYQDGTRSPNEKEREVFGYSAAWMHHKGRNRHHFEYWTDYNPKTHQSEPVKMPERFVVEMFCDRVAASKIYKKDQYTDRSALEYFQHGKSHRSIHSETSAQIERLLTVLAESGEKAAFAACRDLLAKGRTK